MDARISGEIQSMLAADDLLLGAIYRAQNSGITNALELVHATSAANRGVVYNYQKMIAAILDSKFNSASDACAVAVREYKNPTIDYGFDSSGATSMSDVSDALVIQAAQMADSSKVAFKFDLSNFIE
jgi:hypothetical protein